MFEDAPDDLKFDMIRSGQAPADEVARLFRERPEFKAYYEQRVREADEASRALREGRCAT